jgi:hypothetical protein
MMLSTIANQVVQSSTITGYDKNKASIYKISKKRLKNVFARLRNRLSLLDSSTSTIEISTEYAAHFFDMYIKILAKKLKDQEEVVRRQKFHLLVLSSELKERKHNPLGVPGPTPEQQKEAWQKELAERALKASEQERWELC